MLLDSLRRLGDDAWFNLGDKDLATHITRTRLLNEGFRLSQVTEQNSPRPGRQGDDFTHVRRAR